MRTSPLNVSCAFRTCGFARVSELKSNLDFLLLQLVSRCDCCCLHLAVPLQMLLIVCCGRLYLVVPLRAQLLRRVLHATWRCSGSVPNLQEPAGGFEKQGV